MTSSSKLFTVHRTSFHTGSRNLAVNTRNRTDAYSDYRLKENVQILVKTLDFLWCGRVMLGMDDRPQTIIL